MKKRTCRGAIETNIAYPYNDLDVKKKSSTKECQAFCKSDTGCVGWDFNTRDGKCAIKFERTGRGPADGLVSGGRDACVPGKIQIFTPCGLLFFLSVLCRHYITIRIVSLRMFGINDSIQSFMLEIA